MAKIADPEALRCHIDRSVGDLPALPSVVSRVLALTDDPKSTATELQKVVSIDQALSGKIVRVVNSAFYALPCPVASIAHAVMILGVRQLRNLTLSLAAMSLVKARGGRMAEHQSAFWRHSFGVAAAANAIAQHAAVGRDVADDAFTGGLLHDLGRLFLLGYFSDFFEQIVVHARAEEVSIVDAERELIGMDHMEIGSRLAEHWNFPDSLSTIICAHHEPARAGDHFQLVACVHVAERLVSQFDPAAGDAAMAVDGPASEWANLTDSMIAELQDGIAESVRAAEELIGLAAA
jgi:putative nucleotidyltransferase with HDIG domain